MTRLLVILFSIVLSLSFTSTRQNIVLAQEEEEKVVYTGGIKVNLTAEEYQEAKDWGVENKDSPEVVRRPYDFGSSNAFEEGGYVAKLPSESAE